MLPRWSCPQTDFAFVNVDKNMVVLDLFFPQKKNTYWRIWFQVAPVGHILVQDKQT